ncbi:hypothetical protein Q3G72_027392 [Acer saccharum]|nr:hypothetical protein Q3G72_027392 [Acer saccharum]
MTCLGGSPPWHSRTMVPCWPALSVEKPNVPKLRAPPGPTRSNRPTDRDSGRELSRDQQKLIRLMLAHWIQERKRQTQGLVALVKGRMERMASLPFDGSRRGTVSSLSSESPAPSLFVSPASGTDERSKGSEYAAKRH